MVFKMSRKRNVACCILYNDKREVMLQKKTLDHIARGRWCCFGGEIEAGETPPQAVKREMKEEMGFSLRTSFFIERDYSVLNRTLTGKEYVFLAKLNDTFLVNLREGAGFAFFSENETKEIKIVPTHRYLLKRFYDFIYNR